MKEINQYVLKTAFNIARKNKANAVIVHADALEDLIFEDKWPWKFKLYFVSKKKKWDLSKGGKKSLGPKVEDLITIPRMPFTRASLMKLSVLLALSSGKIERGDKIVTVIGTTENSLLDSIQYIDTATETEIITGKISTNISADVNPEVFEALLNFSIELAGKGREGKPVGTIFVVGDDEKVMQLSKQMVINPFKGYTEDERNLLSPSMKETLREFSAMDGAFVITGEGVVLTSGRFLNAAADETMLQRGLGSRHIAAAGITALTKALAFVISESSGDLRIFKDGKLLMEFEKATIKKM
jgi:DNA integrity scanning protein DisA with diadenylate cyclase activity